MQSSYTRCSCAWTHAEVEVRTNAQQLRQAWSSRGLAIACKVQRRTALHLHSSSWCEQAMDEAPPEDHDVMQACTYSATAGLKLQNNKRWNLAQNRLARDAQRGGKTKFESVGTAMASSRRRWQSRYAAI